LKTLASKTRFIRKNINPILNLKEDVESMSYKKEDVYRVEDGNLKKINTVYTYSKNIFSIYSKSCYDLYKEISECLNDSYKLYEIDKHKQNYMIYGKLEKYNKDKNKNWYDFPGINIPFMHGFYFINGNDIKINFQNNKNITVEQVQSGCIILNKPTDLIKIETEIEIDVIEFYISPLFALKNNEPGVWIPII